MSLIVCSILCCHCLIVCLSACLSVCLFCLLANKCVHIMAIKLTVALMFRYTLLVSVFCLTGKFFRCCYSLGSVIQKWTFVSCRSITTNSVKTGGYTVFTFVCLSVHLSVCLCASSSAASAAATTHHIYFSPPQRISRLPQPISHPQTHLPPQTYLFSLTHLPQTLLPLPTHLPPQTHLVMYYVFFRPVSILSLSDSHKMRLVYYRNRVFCYC